MRELIFQHPSFDNSVKLSQFGRFERFRALDLNLTELLVQGLRVLCTSLSIHWLRTHVGGIQLRADLQQLEIIIRNPFLYPEIPSLNAA